MTVLDIISGVPDWLSAYIRAWQNRFALGGWRIRVGLALCVNSNPNTLAACDQYPDVNEAHLTFRADVEDTAEWRRCVIHELIHVAHARIDHLIERAVLPQLSGAAQTLASETYRQAVEPYAEALAWSLWEMEEEARRE